MSKKIINKLTICALFVLIIGIMTSLLSVLIKKTVSRSASAVIPGRIIFRIDFMEDAKKSISLPFKWGFKSNSELEYGIGVILDSIKTAFPYDKSIKVTMSGKAFILNDENVSEHDMEMRVTLVVKPENGILTVQDVLYDTCNVFDSGEYGKEKFIEHMNEIIIRFKKQVSPSFRQIPKTATRIKEMTIDSVTMYGD